MAAWLVLGSEPPTRAADVSLKVMTFNILVEISNDPRIAPWKRRREACAEVIRRFDADLVGLQEPTPGQVQYLVETLPAYASIIAEKYSDATILYRKNRFTVLERGHWWLSPTPERWSTGFGNFLPRIVLWARLRDASGLEFYFINTHFDNTRPSQIKMAELCQQKLAPLMRSGRPLIFTGDFNTNQKKGDYPKLTSNGWQDSYLVSSKASPDGRDDNVSTTLAPADRIDHIFYFGPGIRPVHWERLESPDRSLAAYSDHFAVGAEFRLSKTR